MYTADMISLTIKVNNSVSSSMPATPETSNVVSV